MTHRGKLPETDAQWRAKLTPEQFRITRQSGTERAFSGPHLDEHRAGEFTCIGCGAPLFGSATKFDSGTGWPSFFAPITTQAVSEHADPSLFSTRTEIRCAACDSHLGHVFPDGPEPTGQRYCMNGNALDFTAKTDSE